MPVAQLLNVAVNTSFAARHPFLNIILVITVYAIYMDVLLVLFLALLVNLDEWNGGNWLDVIRLYSKEEFEVIRAARIAARTR
jgi:hypothetical protein